jgi:hypothetical protein
MAKIILSQVDYDFLKDLQHELNTQTNDGNADPVYWGVMEDCEELTFEGEGEVRIPYDDGAYDLEELVADIDADSEDFSLSVKEEWNSLDKNDVDEVMSFVNKNWNEGNIIGEPYWVEIKDKISRYAGAFLTKRACQEYIKRYGYNHRNPRTYAMTAYRNLELERLLNILKTMELKVD